MRIKYVVAKFIRRILLLAGVPMSVPYTFAFVRTDLPKIHQLVQLAHAVQDASIALIPYGKRSGYLITYGLDNRDGLINVMEILRLHQIPFVDFYEEDAGPETNGKPRGLTAISTGLITSRKQREIFKQFNLLWANEESE